MWAGTFSGTLLGKGGQRGEMAEAPVSLYLELEPGQIADLEVVAKASLAFAAAIKEIAYHLDPLLEVRVELDSSTKGSLSINARIKGFKAKYLNRNVILGVAVVVLIYFKDEIRDHVVDKALDEIIPGFSDEKFSPAEKKEIGEIMDEALKKNLGRRETSQVYRELERDKAVKGVGVTTVPATKPKDIVPRSEFRRRSGDAPPVETEVRKRHSEPRATVTLIKPVLEHSRRSWRLKISDDEFGAIMEDDEFVDDLLSEKIRIPMVEGIQLDVTFSVDEEMTPQGVWEIKSRKIIKVHGQSRAPSQPSLDLPPQLRPVMPSDEDDEH